MPSLAYDWPAEVLDLCHPLAGHFLRLLNDSTVSQFLVQWYYCLFAIDFAPSYFTALFRYCLILPLPYFMSLLPFSCQLQTFLTDEGIEDVLSTWGNVPIETVPGDVVIKTMMALVHKLQQQVPSECRLPLGIKFLTGKHIQPPHNHCTMEFDNRTRAWMIKAWRDTFQTK